MVEFQHTAVSTGLFFLFWELKHWKKFNFECTCKQHTLVSRLSSTNSICYVPSDGVTRTSKTRWWLWGASSSRGQEHVHCVRITRHASCLRAQTLAQRLSLNVSAGTYEPCALGRAPVAQPQVPNQAVPVSICAGGTWGAHLLVLLWGFSKLTQNGHSGPGTMSVLAVVIINNKMVQE